MNRCSEATLVSSFITRADSKLEVKKKQFVSERVSGRESNESFRAGNRIRETSLNRANSEPLVHPAAYPALCERATSDPSQSRRRCPYLPEHENIKAEVVPSAPTLPPRMEMLNGQHAEIWWYAW
ncbi:hypothetical protein M405DRAFT_815821, partial [Rhizopogon salebrosus TDB-379]